MSSGISFRGAQWKWRGKSLIGLTASDIWLGDPLPPRMVSDLSCIRTLGGSYTLHIEEFELRNVISPTQCCCKVAKLGLNSNAFSFQVFVYYLFCLVGQDTGYNTENISSKGESKQYNFSLNFFLKTLLFLWL